MSDFDFVRNGFIQAQKSLAALRVTAAAGEIFLLQNVPRQGTISAPQKRQSINSSSIGEETFITISSTRDQYSEADKPKLRQIIKHDGVRYIVDEVSRSGHHYKIVAYDPQTRNTGNSS